MKELNRREFLTLSGAAVVALSLAGCGAPSAPPAAPTGKEAKVLEAINLFRKEKGWGTLNQDDGLNALAEKAVDCALGKIGVDELTAEMVKNSTLLNGPYQKFGQPIGVVEKGKPTMHYDEDVSKMKKALLALSMVDIEDNLALPNLKIIGIKVFTGNDGKLYWVALVAESKN
ncbi:MAG: twin-arginine translocation signal domain-containing protein [Faecalibacterium sp.]